MTNQMDASILFIFIVTRKGQELFTNEMEASWKAVILTILLHMLNTNRKEESHIQLKVVILKVLMQKV